MTGSPLLVLHDVGDAGGGRPWALAFETAGWEGEVLAPDLPGHAGAPAPEGGQYELSDAAFVSVPLLARLGSPVVVVGVGVNGWSASLCGLGGKASAVVLVDGTGAPWISAADAVRWQREWMRDIADDPEAVAPMPAGAPLDPRLLHGIPPHGSRKLAFRAAGRLAVPLLLMESPASAWPVDDAEAIAAAASGGGAVVRLPDRSPATVAAAVVRWLDQQEPPRPR
jgi:pimeloyl-ACP methyl ester carboxylesterase